MDFFTKIKIAPDGCHLWTGAKIPRGYGRYSPLGRRGKRYYAHRFAWEIANGRAVPDGAVVCHRCDNPSCVNPSHLFVGTQADNMKDMARKGRSTKGEASGRAKLTRSQVSEILSSVTASREIAPHYGVSAGHIRSIRSGKRWGDA